MAIVASFTYDQPSFDKVKIVIVISFIGKGVAIASMC